MKKLRCPRCGYTWLYRGKKERGITSCPACHTTMDINLAQKRARGYEPVVEKTKPYKDRSKWTKPKRGRRKR